MKDYTCLKDMYESSEFESFRSDKLGNNLFISDPDRAERTHDAAESGADGSTHAEVIEDWREFLDSLKVFDPKYDEEEDKAKCDLTPEVYDKISKEIDEVEEWHEKNGSLYQEIG